MAEFLVELGRKSFVVGYHEDRSIGLLDDVGYGEGLPGTRDTHQDLVCSFVFQPSIELLDGFCLVSFRCEIREEFE